MSSLVLHPKCGKSFTNSDAIGHCAACCETFVGLEAFDKHRRGGKCNKLPGTDPLFWQDGGGRWHYSRRMTEADKARVFG